jgi:hypothetical protein
MTSVSKKRGFLRNVVDALVSGQARQSKHHAGGALFAFEQESSMMSGYARTLSGKADR